MITDKSCGAIVYTKESGNIEYVIIRSKEGIYGFPKGRMEENESETETALREVAEEVGLTVALISEFRLEDTHTFSRNGETRLKHIVYFLGEYSAQTPTAQETELNGVYLMNYETAMSTFQFENSKRLLTDAHNFLMQL
ncbi:MAG: NUDIX domain-containing protein [Clostridia bacterium]|nr:NUDIX domain-containing protein [Clostridia bacterium]